MKWKIVFVLLCTMPLFCLGADRIHAIANSMGKCATSEGYVDKLKMLGMPESLLVKYSKSNYAGYLERDIKNQELPLFTKAHFVKVEIYSPKLLPINSNDNVTVIVFSTGSEKTDLRVYFLFVHDANDNLVKFKNYEMLICDRVPEDLVTVKLSSLPGTRKDILTLELYKVESCGDEIVFYQKADTLILHEKGVVEKEGKIRNRESYDRFLNSKSLK